MVLDGQSSQSIARAAQALQRGDLIGLPTETVYGLGSAIDSASVDALLSLKRRNAETIFGAIAREIEAIGVGLARAAVN